MKVFIILKTEIDDDYKESSADVRIIGVYTMLKDAEDKLYSLRKDIIDEKLTEMFQDECCDVKSFEEKLKRFGISIDECLISDSKKITLVKRYDFEEVFEKLFEGEFVPTKLKLELVISKLY